MDKIPASAADVKIALKEAMREWLDDKYAEVGRWAIRGILAAAVFALGYFILTMNGWHRL